MMYRSISRPLPTLTCGYPMHKSHQSQRGVDGWRIDRHHRRGQLLRRAAGRLRHDAGLERGKFSLRNIFCSTTLKKNK